MYSKDMDLDRARARFLARKSKRNGLAVSDISDIAPYLRYPSCRRSWTLLQMRKIILIRRRWLKLLVGRR